MADDAAERARRALEAIGAGSAETKAERAEMLAEGRKLVAPITDFLKQLHAGLRTKEAASIRVDDGQSAEGHYVCSYDFAHEAKSARLTLRVIPTVGRERNGLDVTTNTLGAALPALDVGTQNYGASDVPALADAVEKAAIRFFAEA